MYRTVFKYRIVHTKQVFISVIKNTLTINKLWYKKVDTLVINRLEKHTLNNKKFDSSVCFFWAWCEDFPTVYWFPGSSWSGNDVTVGTRLNRRDSLSSASEGWLEVFPFGETSSAILC